MRPISASPTGTLATAPVRLTGSPSLTCSHSPKSAAPTLSSSRLNARPVTPCSNSSISDETAVLEAVDAGDPVADLEDGADLGEVGLDVVLLDPLLQDRGDLFGAKLQRFSSLGRDELVGAAGRAGRARSRRRAMRADLQDDAADQVGVDGARRLDLAARGLLDLLQERLRLVVGELERGRQLDVEDGSSARRRARSNSRAISVELRRRGPSRRATSRKLRSSSSAPPSTSSSAAAFVARVELGVARAARAARAPRRIGLDEVAELARGPRSSRPCSCAASKSARAYVRCDDGHASSAPLAARRSRARRSPRRSGACGRRRRATLPVTFVGGEQASGRRPRRGSARARGASRPRSACASPRAAAGGRPRAPRACARSLRLGDAARLGEDLLGLGLRACADQRAVLLEQLARLLAGLVGLVERLRGSARAARRSSSGSGRTRTASARRT